MDVGRGSVSNEDDARRGANGKNDQSPNMQVAGDVTAASSTGSRTLAPREFCSRKSD
jgi:hypothetical protein